MLLSVIQFAKKKSHMTSMMQASLDRLHDKSLDYHQMPKELPHADLRDDRSRARRPICCI